MPITEKQRERRRNWIGSSDMPAVLGVDPWKSAEEVRLEKLGRLDERDETAAMRAGNMLERSVLLWARGELGDIHMNPQNVQRSVQEWHLFSNLDAVLADGGYPIEAKTAGLHGPLMDEWGEPGTDEVPDRVIVQAHVHMICTGKDRCYVPALLGGRGFQMFVVQATQTLLYRVSSEAKRFWEINVERDVPCDTSLSLDALSRVRRELGLRVEIPADAVQYWKQAREFAKFANTIEEQAKARVIAALGTGEVGDWGGDEIVTYTETSRRAYSVPDGTYRALRLKKRPKELPNG